MKLPDPASLSNLNDIVLPANPGWWPLAPGWYILFGALALVLIWSGVRFLRNWRANRYRRAALDQLDLIEKGIKHADSRDSSLRQLPELLKRTALSVYPRQQVASLSGTDWFDFLNSTADKSLFTDSISRTLETISYSGGDLAAVKPEAASTLIYAIQQWLKHHHLAGHRKHAGGRTPC